MADSIKSSLAQVVDCQDCDKSKFEGWNCKITNRVKGSFEYIFTTFYISLGAKNSLSRDYSYNTDFCPFVVFYIEN